MAGLATININNNVYLWCCVLLNPVLIQTFAARFSSSKFTLCVCVYIYVCIHVYICVVYIYQLMEKIEHLEQTISHSMTYRYGTGFQEK